MIADPLIKMVRMYEDVPVPKIQNQGDSGFDLHAYLTREPFCSHTYRIAPHTTVLLWTGIKLAIPTGFEGQVRSRSSMAKRDIIVANQPGTIDSGYRGEIGVLLHNLSDSIRFIDHGDRIAQLVICPVAAPLIYECNVLDETERGEGGFGSTGQ